VPIEIGLRKGGRVEVKLGLTPGDTIVTAGTHKVIEGRKLRAAVPAKSDQARGEPPASESQGSGS
jgi:multidrug efflux pump subunit AcrA (membrane-fusion protein)